MTPEAWKGPKMSEETGRMSEEDKFLGVRTTIEPPSDTTTSAQVDEIDVEVAAFPFGSDLACKQRRSQCLKGIKTGHCIDDGCADSVW